MKPADFDFLTALVKEQSGLILSSDKAYLLESRLMSVARKRGLKGLDELTDTIRKTQEKELIREVTEAMTTNESFFFRDTRPFDIFRDVLMPDILKTRATAKSLRIWCAAASSGQEPYSLAIILKEMAPQLAGWKIEIIGTDISRDILAKAKKGVYTQFEVQRGLPIQLLLKYFTKKEEVWEINSSLQEMVTYKEYNLLDDLKPLGKFDVVFCRNVLIYFNQETKGKVLDQISALLPADGKLFLGGAETVIGVSEKFKPLSGQRGVYCVVGSEAQSIAS
jgi:chemotaxis protein methyltransferase CheR